MSRSKNHKHQTEMLLQAVASLPEGAALEQLVAAVGPLAISRNTVIRRLQEMVEAGTLIKTGKSRATRYLLPGRPAPAPDRQLPHFPNAAELPLSKGGRDVRRLITRPVNARTPVGYQRAFLDGYRPNDSAYLTEAERSRLAEIGRAATPDEPAGTHAQQILGRLLIDLSWNSSRLEGNTYSLLDTQRLIDLGETAEGKDAAEAQMILNHKAAIEFLVQSAGDIAFNRPTVLNLHALLAENLLPDPQAAGRLRSIPIGISGSVYHPLVVPQLIEEAFDQVLATAAAINDPFEQSFFVMVQLPYLQPFDDVNKRVSRLAANIPMIRHNLAPLSFVDVSKDLYTRALLGVYELNRVDLLKDVYLWAYERSAQRYGAIRQTVGQPDPFRLRHRQAMKTIVAEVVRDGLDKKAAAKALKQWAEAHIASEERAKFVELTEAELLGLHEGNFARYPVTPRAFKVWQEVWNRTPERRKASSKGA